MKKLKTVLILIVFIFSIFIRNEKAHANTNVVSSVDMVGFYHEVINQIQVQFNANVFIDGTTITIIKDGHTYIATDPQGLKQIINTLEATAVSAGSVASTGFLKATGYILASALAFYGTYQATLGIAEATGFTDQKTLESLNMHVSDKLKNPSTEVQSAIDALFFNLLTSEGNILRVPVNFLDLLRASIKDFFDVNYELNEINYFTNVDPAIFNYHGTAMNASAIGSFNDGIGFITIEQGGSRKTFRSQFRVYSVAGIALGRTQHDGTGFRIRDGQFANVSGSTNHGNSREKLERIFADYNNRTGFKSAIEFNKALNIANLTPTIDYSVYPINMGSAAAVRDYLMGKSNEELEEDLKQKYPSVSGFDKANSMPAIDRSIDEIDSNNPSLGDLPTINIEDENKSPIPVQDLFQNPNQDFITTPGSTPGTNPGTGPGTGPDTNPDLNPGGGGGTETVPDDDSINWEELKEIGAAFTRVFPFSIPWDFHRIFTGTFDVEPTPVKISMPLLGADLGFTIDESTYSYLYVIHVFFRLVAMLGLLMLMHKWMGAQK